ncbi:PDR/VanB family oxidoreductase [Mycolicibacterium palauense]|uniref:PDR/VanB family oxidoreductase n=1 Tax=Mycolicibacterium palauense TaxID=2034511 RepID=UPI001FEC35AB|nr:PDR/VanB family oxidoreductase [Mycolicibacterium palauense]
MAHDIVAITLCEPDGGPVPAWEPGAHVDVQLGDMTRQYSLCGDPTQRQSLTIAVLREPASRGGSAFVHDKLAVDDLVDVSQPRNHFPLVTAPSYLFVAGGIGITPLLPMIGKLAAQRRPWRLLYGGRSRSSMAFADILEDDHRGNVELRPQDEYGLLDLAAAVRDAEAGAAVYCCGPEPLLTAMESVCAKREDVDLHVERFAPKPAADRKVAAAFEVVLGRSGDSVMVTATESLLDALLRHGVEVDFSCREGTCGTCEVTVIDGVPDHRDSVLTTDEKAANDVMMACVSRSCGKRLILDL